MESLKQEKITENNKEEKTMLKMKIEEIEDELNFDAFMEEERGKHL